MRKELSSVAFNSLEKLSVALNEALKDGKAISFHNNGGTFSRHQIPNFDAVLINHHCSAGYLKSNPDDNCSNGVGVGFFLPYQYHFFTAEGERLRVGGEMIIKSIPLWLREDAYKSGGDLTSDKYGPKIGELIFRPDLGSQGRFINQANQIFYWQKV